MNTLLVVLGIGIFIFLLVWSIRTPSRWQRLIQTTAEDGVIEPLLVELYRRPPMLQSRFYDEAMQQLIVSNPDAAVRLTLSVVPKYPDNKRSQTWLTRLQETDTTVGLLPAGFVEQYSRSCCSLEAG